MYIIFEWYVGIDELLVKKEEKKNSCKIGDCGDRKLFGLLI